MGIVTISKDKLDLVISDVERLVSHFEDLVEDQDQIARDRLKEIKTGCVEGKSESELDEYLKKRGVKVV